MGYYIQGLKYLFKTFGKRDLPLIVNTCGWVSHLGYDVLLEIVGMTIPDVIVQIVTDDNDIIEKEDVNDILYDVCDKLPRMRKFDSMAQSATHTAMSLTSAEHRTAHLLAYFGDHDCPIAAGKAWAIPFEEVAVGFVGQEVPPSQAFYALNGSVVGLCCNDVPTKKKVGVTNEEFSKKLPAFLVGNPRPCNCLGLGIIKSIDVENGLFYIITPVDLVIIIIF